MPALWLGFNKQCHYVQTLRNNKDAIVNCRPYLTHAAKGSTIEMGHLRRGLAYLLMQIKLPALV